MHVATTPLATCEIFTLAISKLNPCPSSVYGSPGTLHSGVATPHGFSGDGRCGMSDFFTHALLGEGKKKQTHTKQEPSPFQTNADHLLTNSDHI